MSVRFRNVNVDTSEPIDAWPAEAIHTVIERGALSDWRRLADCIRANPWGPAARTVEDIIAWGEHYGVDSLMRNVLQSARRDFDARGRATYAARIRQVRTGTGLSLRAFARIVGTSASRLSDYENAKVSPTTDVLGRIEQVAERHT